MAELKTKETKVSVRSFFRTLEDEGKRKDALVLLKLFEAVTGEKGKLWGTAIVGFGKYHYESTKSAQKGDWPLTGFSPRKQNISIYIMNGFKDYANLLEGLGTFKISGGSCLYVKKLTDIDLKKLEKLIKTSVRDMKKKYTVT